MNNWPETNTSLIRRIKESADDAAWSHFLSIYRPVVMRLAMSRGLQHADAEDLTQIVFSSVAAAIDKYRPQRDERQFRYWLGRICRNAIVNAITRNPAQKVELREFDRLCEEPAREASDLSAELLKLTRAEAIRWAAGQVRPEFTEDTWQMFWLSSIDGQASSDVATRMKKTRGAVYIARCRVIQRIKEVLMQSSDLWSEGQ
ncbi:MAG: sigma-70 family RNA polymerase sigma factor [Planctomycetaceae bacterium]|nr:sigma-70 family RNA polymerase sigma factor [Planctomycetaceae bacterium]